MRRALWTNLVSPEQLVPAPVLRAVPNVEELSDSMGPNVISVWFGVIPREGGAEGEETHCARRCGNSANAGSSIGFEVRAAVA